MTQNTLHIFHSYMLHIFVEDDACSEQKFFFFFLQFKVITEAGYGRKSDIWSVGCTVFEMATGKPPLAHMDKLAALFYIGAQRGSMPSLPEGFSRHASNFVDICLTR